MPHTNTDLQFPLRNAFIIPVVYFFYPETAYRSLKEIDDIFRKTQRGWRGWFGVVQTARDEPRKYGKNGELLVGYEGENGDAGLGLREKKSDNGERRIEDVARGSEREV